MKTTTAPAVIAHEFHERAAAPDERRAFKAYGPTPEAARLTMSEPDTYVFTGTTTRTPYTHHDRAAAICDALAATTGKGWTARPQSDEYPDCAYYLTRADGLTLYMNPPSQYDPTGTAPFRFSLSPPRRAGAYIEAYTGTGSGWTKATSPTIGTAATKTPEQMARDIARRLLPLAEIHHAATLARIASLDAADNAQHQTAAAICAALGTAHGTDYHTKKPRTNDSFGALDWQAFEGGNASLTLRSLPGPVAAIIARALSSILADESAAAERAERYAAVLDRAAIPSR